MQAIRWHNEKDWIANNVWVLLSLLRVPSHLICLCQYGSKASNALVKTVRVRSEPYCIFFQAHTNAVSRENLEVFLNFATAILLDQQSYLVTRR